MKTIFTAKKFLAQKLGKTPIGILPELLIEFAALHVQAALKAASEKAKTTYLNEWNVEDVKLIRQGHESKIDKESVLNAYPLTNIK